MEYSVFEKKFIEKAKECNININNIEKFYKFMELLIEWNEKINLTAITKPDEILEKHFLDSLTIQKYIKENDKVIDVGTGAGFPGIPLAICNNFNITLLDSLNKRVNFLNEVKEQISLKNVETIHGRAEEIAQNPKYREKYDIATSRAVAPMNVLLEYLLPFVKVGGLCLCMKGPNVKEEMENTENALKILGGSIQKIENIKLLDGKIERNIVAIKKEKQTPSKYPRKAGTPSKQPLN